MDSRVLAREAKRAEQGQAAMRPSRTIAFGTDAFQELLDTLIAANQQGVLALGGELLLEVDEEVVLVRGWE